MNVCNAGSFRQRESMHAVQPVARAAGCPSKLRLGRAFVLLACLGCGLAGRALGVNGVWIYSGNATWSTPARWAGSVIADGAGATAWFTNNISANSIITIDGAVASRTLGALHIGDSGATYYRFDFAPSVGGTLTFNNGSARAQINKRVNATAETISVPLILASSLDLNNASATVLTLTGGLTGTGNLAFYANGAGGFTLSTLPVNITGVITNAGAGAGTTTISGGVGTTVPTIVQVSTNSPLTISTTALTVNAGGTSLINHSPSGAKVFTLSGGTTGTGNLVLKNNSAIANGITLAAVAGKTLNHAGLIVNAGTGAGNTYATLIISNKVTGVIQESPTSMLTLAGNSTAYTNGVTIKAGTVYGLTSGNCFGSGGIVALGDTSGSASATLSGGTTIARPITVTAGNTGKASITAGGTAVFSGPVTLANHGLSLYTTAAATLTLSGGISGTGNLLLDIQGIRAIALSTQPVNPVGVITNLGAGSATATISGGVGANVPTIVQVSTNSPLTISTTALTVDGGGKTLINASPAGTKLFTLSGGTTGTGNLTLKNNSVIANGITVSGTALNHAGAITNSGTGSGAVLVSAGVGANVTAVTQASGSSSLTLSGSLTVNAGGKTLANASGAALTVSGGATGTGSLVLKNNSATDGGITVSGTSLNPAGSITNSGTGAGGVLVAAVIGANVTRVVQNSTTSMLTLTGNNTYAGGTTVENGKLLVANTAGSGTGTGTVLINDDGVLTNSGTIAGTVLINADGVLVNNGTISGAVTNNSGGLLAGNGTLSGTVNVKAGGTVSPGPNGASVGKLMMGNLNWHGGGDYRCTVTSIDGSGSGAGVDYDQIVVSGALAAVTNGNNLVIRLDSLGETLAFDGGQNYGLKVLSYGTAPGFNLANITVDTSDFLVGGSWSVTNLNNALYVVSMGSTPSPSVNYWIGSGLWSTNVNWSLNHVPLAGEAVEFDFNHSLGNCTIDVLGNAVASVTISAGYTGSLTFQTRYPGQGVFTNFVVTGNLAVNGGVLTHTANTGLGTAANRLAISVGGDFTLGSYASINLDGCGYAANYGPGAGVSGTAATRRSASHGGAGANNPVTSSTYGSVTQPETLGSGANGAGGGALILRVGGTATLDGLVTAQGVGGSATACPGAGGSIFITADSVAGSSSLQAGVATTGFYGSGGGRIAVIATNGASLGTLTFRANPSASTQDGGGRAGTVYLETTAFKRLIVDQENIGTASANYTDLPAASETFAIDPALGGVLEDATLVMTNGACVRIMRDLRMSNIVWMSGLLSLNAWTFYVKADEPAGAFPGDYGGGSITLPGIFYTFANGDTLTRDGRLLWGDASVTWRAVSAVHGNAGGTNTIDLGASEGYYAPGSELSFAATPVAGYEFLHWDGTVPTGISATNNPLVMPPLAGNLALRSWFRDESLDLSTNTWVATPSDDNWFEPLNWSLFTAPAAGQTVIIPAGAALRLSGATPRLGRFEFANTSTLTFEGWNSTLNADECVIAGTVIHAPQTVTTTNSLGQWVPQHRIWIQGSNLTLTATGSLNADYMGYPGGAGPGASTLAGGYGGAGGGGYGGNGGSGFGGAPPGPAYGDFADPWQPGSGGKQHSLSGSGGGAVRVELSGRATIDGSISARGQTGLGTHGPAGSGGGIAITCDTFQGAATGLVRVDAGRGNFYGGNGGGGRIALHYNPGAQMALENPRPPVRFSAQAWRLGTRGDDFTVKAQMGTLFLTDLTLLAGSPTAAAVLDGQRFWYTRLIAGNSFTNWSPASLSVSNCVIGFPEGFELQVGEDLLVAGPAAPLVGDTAVGAGLVLYATATNRLYGARLRVGRDLTLGDKAWFYPHTEGYSAAVVGVRVGRNVSVAASGGIDANETGYMPQLGNLNGPGAGLDADSGGAYGGAGGGAMATQPYGDAALPLEPGSPGGWRIYGGFTSSGRGGGAVHLLAGGNLVIDGLVTANGSSGYYYYGPAGSGGSILLTGMRVSGSGTLRANGGAGALARGPGGGGRIAIWHHMPLDTAEQRIAAQDASGLILKTAPLFTGELHADVTASILANQPGAGTTGFYTITGTLIILR